MQIPLSNEEATNYRLYPSIDGKRGPVVRLLCDYCNEFLAEWDYRQEVSIIEAINVASAHSESVH